LNNILVTGGYGFIGSHLIKFLLSSASYSESHIYNLDYMGDGSNFYNLEETISKNKRFSFVKGDINDVDSISNIRDVDTIINVAAETHVDRSINKPSSFTHSNYNGTFALLEYSRSRDVEKYIQVSTDEVYGEAGNNYSFKEDDNLNPSNPYSSTKAAADLLVSSYFKTYGLRTAITRCTNNFGSHQFPEKLIPRTIIKILHGLDVLIYGSGDQVRDWIYVLDHVKAIDIVTRKGLPGETYNISASNPMRNLDLVKRISSLVEAKTAKSARIKSVEDRPGHDYRYSLDSTKINTELGWKPETKFESSLEETVDWYLDNEAWWHDFVDPYVTNPHPWKSGNR
jgi:dTDP-glucose 4,6-dehydratase